MTASNLISSTVLKRYASALLDLAEKSKSTDSIQKDFGVLRAMLAESTDFVQFVRSPLSGKKQQAEVMNTLLEKQKLNTLTMNFVGVLIQNRRLNVLEGVMDAFDRMVSERKGVVRVLVETAHELNAKQKEDVSVKISSALGKDVIIDAQVVPEIIGGTVITIGSYMIDDSVRRKIERLGAALTGSANQNTIQNVKEVV